MTRERRQLLMVAVLVLLIGYLGWTRGGSLFDRGAAPGPGGSRAARSVVGAEIVELHVGDLEKKPGTYRPGRDLFRYGRAPAPVRPPTQRRMTPPPQPRPQPRQETAEPVAAPEATPPPIDVVYLGSFGRSGRKIAVFADDEAIYNAMVGDVVKDQFLLVAIGYESADLGFVEFPDAEAERLAVGGS